MTIREIRNTRRVEAVLQSGTIIELRKRTHAIALITPIPKPEQPKKIEWPDFEARAKKIFGDRVFNAVDEFLQYRHRD